ncbi:MAG: adenylate/guanylate cyclase domain-containing protein [Thermodesulfovibrionales bacterium]
MKIRRRKLFRIAAVGLAASILVTGMSSLGYLDALQRRVLDFMIWWRPAEPPEDVVIAAIDDEAFRMLGEQQPLPRKRLASLLRLIQACGPVAIGLDIDLSSQTRPADDRELLEAVKGRVIIPYELLSTPQPGEFHAVPVFTSEVPEGAGFANSYQDSDGVVRRAPLVLRDESGNLLGSFGFEIYRAAERSRGRVVPADGFAGREIRIHYAGGAGTFPAVPAGPLMKLSEEGVAPPEENPFRGKIVLVGATFRAGRDAILTPKGVMSGVEVHANIVNTLVTGRQLKKVNPAIAFFMQVLISGVTGLFFLLFRPWKAGLLGSAAVVFVFAPLSFALFERGGYWLDLVTPFAAVACAGIAHDTLERRRVRKAFRQYVSDDVLRQLSRDEESLEGRTMTVTVLFADIRGFTALTETMSLDRLMPLLNEYLQLMTEAVHRHGGMINKFIGDAVMAIFGAPIARAGHAQDAVDAALCMTEELARMNATLAQEGIGPLRIGIGVHTGEVFAGNVGSEKRKEYTIIGDAVNTASRIEGMNKELSTTILISETTHAAVAGFVEASDRGVFRLRGKHQPVRLFELAGRTKEART